MRSFRDYKKKNTYQFGKTILHCRDGEFLQEQHWVCVLNIISLPIECRNSPCFVRLDSAVFVAQKQTEESSINHREATFGVFQSECYNKTKSGHIYIYMYM